MKRVVRLTTSSSSNDTSFFFMPSSSACFCDGWLCLQLFPFFLLVCRLPPSIGMMSKRGEGKSQSEIYNFEMIMRHEKRESFSLSFTQRVDSFPDVLTGKRVANANITHSSFSLPSPTVVLLVSCVLFASVISQILHTRFSTGFFCKSFKDSI